MNYCIFELYVFCRFACGFSWRFSNHLPRQSPSLVCVVFSPRFGTSFRWKSSTPTTDAEDNETLEWELRAEMHVFCLDGETQKLSVCVCGPMWVKRMKAVSAL